MKTLVLLGGSLYQGKEYQKEKFDCIIAADGGLISANKLGFLPTHIVGDFDTASKELVNFYREKNIPIRTFQPEKDMTDSQIAVEMAVEYGSEEIYILGGIGTRMDHTIGNIQLLALPLREKIPCYLCDDYNRIQLIQKEKILKKSEVFGTYISLLPFTSTIENLTLEGFKYPLKHHTMDIMTNLTRGISNELKEEIGKITFSEGILILIESRD